MTRLSLWLLRMMAQVSHLYEVQRNRRSVRQLANWSDRELNDIGLCRADVDSALAQPMLLDSSRSLREARQERRTNGKHKPSPVGYA